MADPVVSTPVTQVLTALGVPFRVFEHTAPVESLAQAARERGQTPDQVVRSIVFRVGEAFVMVLTHGERQVHWPTLRRYLNQKRLTLATEAEVLAVTGYVRGTVSPVGVPPMRVLAEASLFDQTEISLGSGRRNTTVILSPAALRQAVPHLEVGRFAAASES